MRALLTFLLLTLWVSAAAAAVPQADSLWQQGDYRGAFAQAIEPAIHGDPHAQFLIGEAYRLGRSVDPNFPLAEDWYERAARQGDVGAATELGLMLIGQHLEAAAAPWLTIAAQHGEPRALCSLAALYYNGEGVPRDEARAFALMSRAAAAGLAEAQARLATLRTLVSPEVQSQSAALGPAAIPAAAAPPAAPTVQIAEQRTKPAAPVRIQVGAFRSATAAEQAWSKLTDKIEGLEAHHAVVRAGAVYRLQAQLADDDAARDFCRRLQAAGWQVFPRQGNVAGLVKLTDRHRSGERLRPDIILERHVADHERLAKAGVGIILARIETLRAYIDRVHTEQEAPRATRARFVFHRLQQASAPAARLPWSQQIDTLQFKIAFFGRAIERGRGQHSIADRRAKFGFQNPRPALRIAEQPAIPVRRVVGVDMRHDGVARMIVREAMQERGRTEQS
jgi:TPR repeat protein